MLTDENKRLLRPLSPISDLDDGDEQFLVYKKFLKDAFEQPEIKNIALSGNYGAGKSSIIHSFDKSQNGKEEKYLYISLSDFEFIEPMTRKQDIKEIPLEDDENKKNPKQETQKRVEYSLLCQILTRCRRCHLRFSNLCGIPESPMRIGTAIVLSLFTALLFVLIYHYQFALWTKIIGITPECWEKIHAWMYVIAMMGVGGIACYLFRRFRLHKLSLTAPYANAEMALEHDNTSLDIYKFEIVYALEKIADRIAYTVVFEDMDRLDPKICVAVMTKLRDINGMVNTRRRMLHRSSKKHIRFVYAIGEDVFNHAQRTKFYDCIIPVVPAMNRYNAESIICQMLSRCDVDTKDDILWVTLQKLFPFLSDYRTVITFCNEFQVLCSLFTENYQEQRNPSNDSTMLSLCFYKVMAPKNYALMFHEQRDGSLPKVTPEDLANEYENEEYCNELANLLNSLDISYRDLEILYLSRNTIRKQYMEVLTTGADSRRSDLAHKMARDKSVDLSEYLINKRIFETEADPSIAINLATHIRNNKDQKSYEDWFYDLSGCCNHKFTNCMAYLTTDLDSIHTTVVLPQGDSDKLFEWCIRSLPSLTEDPGHEKQWKTRMIEMLKLILEIKPLDVPKALMTIQLDEKQTVGDILKPTLKRLSCETTMSENWVLELMRCIDEDAPMHISQQEFIDWCIDRMSMDDDEKRYSLIQGMNSDKINLSHDMIQREIIEQEPNASIAAKMIQYMFRKAERDVFNKWFFELKSTRKFSGCICFLSEDFDNILTVLKFTASELHTWVENGLRLLCEDTEHLDMWDADMCTTMKNLLLYGYDSVGIISDDILHISLTHDTIVADVLGIDLDTTAEESARAEEEYLEGIPSKN